MDRFRVPRHQSGTNLGKKGFRGNHLKRQASLSTRQNWNSMNFDWPNWRRALELWSQVYVSRMTALFLFHLTKWPQRRRRCSLAGNYRRLERGQWKEKDEETDEEDEEKVGKRNTMKGRKSTRENGNGSRVFLKLAPLLFWVGWAKKLGNGRTECEQSGRPGPAGSLVFLFVG